MEDSAHKQRALELWNEGVQHHMHGDFDGAIALYTKSIEVCPTAEGYTYMGWALSKQGKIEEAIQYCHRAIEEDPEFGNPYNDIGVYMMNRNQLDEAIPWLERAKLARRYEPRHYPYLNLGKLYAARGELKAATREWEAAVEVLEGYAINEPGDDRVREEMEALEAAIEQLDVKLN